MKLAPRPFTISPSSIGTFYKCSAWFKWNYIDRCPPDPNTDNFYAVLGTTFHKCMELHDLYGYTEEQLREFWPMLFHVYMSELNNIASYEDPSEFIRRGPALISSGLDMKERWKGRYKVIGNESRFSIKYDNPYIKGLKIIGIVDLVLQSLEDKDSYIIFDWKTARKRDEELDVNIQLTLYIMWALGKYKVPIENIKGALAYPALRDILFTNREESHIVELKDKIDKMLKRISEGDWKKEPKLNNTTEDCHFCSYKTSCDRKEI